MERPGGTEPYAIGICKTEGNKVYVRTGKLKPNQIQNQLSVRPATEIPCGGWHALRGTLARQYEWQLPLVAPATSAS